MNSFNRISFVFLFFLFTFHLGYTQSTRPLEIEDIWLNYRFYPKGVDEIHSLKQGIFFTKISQDQNGKSVLVKYAYQSGKALDTLIKAEDLPNLELRNYVFNPSEDKVLIEDEIEPIYRHSNRGNFYVFDLRTKKLSPITTRGKQQEASFSPDGKKVAFIRDNNLYYKDLESDSEIQVSSDGLKNSIINGLADWVYEEEFSFSKAFFWSPDSKKIGFYRFDERRVPEYSIPIYKDLYPTLYTYKYPKAGERNSLISIKVFDLASASTLIMNLGADSNIYIPRIAWSQDPNQLCIYRLNRHQNHLEYLLANSTTGNIRLLLELKDSKYIDISKNDDLTFLAGNKEFILSNDESGYLHYYRYNMSGKLLNPITQGNWDVSKLYGVDLKKGLVYFQAARVNPMQREIYSIGLNGKGLKKLTIEAGNNEAEFNNDFTYFINSYSNINQAPKISVVSASGKPIRVLENNNSIDSLKQVYGFQKYAFLEIPVPGQKLNAWMLKPRDFDPGKKYPVLMYVYGGPGIQTVQDQFDGFDQAWYQILADKGYIVVSVDGRGTGQRGSEFEKATYLNLGKFEVTDQIEAGRWLAQQSYIDPKRVGIWGWSFGGYVSSLCITKGNDVFKMAIAIAPVTNWRYYDSIYTERYMTTPEENPMGYDDNSPVNFADRLKGNFLIVHGTADDNVHLQNSIMFSEALIQLNKKFSQAYYPNRNHGIMGGNTRNHLYHRMTDFILANL